MGAALGAGDKKSVNVDLNIVPFIDLMSCLTAFLLVTAAWVNIAQLNIRPKGKSNQAQVQQENEDPVLSILIQSDLIWMGVSRVGDAFTQIEKTSICEPNVAVDKSGKCHDWKRFKDELQKQKDSSFFKEREDLELAAESTGDPQSTTSVSYQDLVTAMDIAVGTCSDNPNGGNKICFRDVGLTDAQGLSERPHK